MKNFHFLLFGIVLIFNANAQSPILKWKKSFTGNYNSYDLTSVIKMYNVDKSIYIAGTSDSYGTANDIVLIKRDYTTGDTIWTRRYNGPANADDQMVDIEINQTTGDVYITGKSLGEGTAYDIVTLKYSSDGTFGWAMRWDNSSYHSDDIPKDIGLDSDGKIYISAYTFNGENQWGMSHYEDLLVLVYNSSGVQINSKTVDTGLSYIKDIVQGARVNANGDIFIAGERIKGTYSNGTSSVFVGGLKSNLDTYWYSIMGFGFIEIKPATTIYSPDDFNFYNAMDLDNSNNVYVATLMDTIISQGTFFKIVISKINSSGNIVWQKKVSGNSNYQKLKINSIKVDPNNQNVYAVGYETNVSGNFDWFVIKYNSSGVLQWQVNKNGGGNADDIAFDIAFDSKQNPIVAGVTRNAIGNDDITFVKYNKITGDEIFSQNYDSGNYDQKAINIMTDAFENIYINGLQKDDNFNLDIVTLSYCNPISSAGEISGSTTVCQGETNITYSVPAIFGANSYAWTLPEGASGISVTNSIVVNFSVDAISGDIIVKGKNDCILGSESKLKITVTPSTFPTIQTLDIDSVTFVKAKCGGNVTYSGCPALTVRGICWNTSGNPTISDAKTTEGSGMGSFTSQITGLIPGSTYYVRAYATNFKGTFYGEEKPFSTKNSNDWYNVTDIDGNDYTTVTIGTQVWLGQNLKTTKYNDGSGIPNVMDNTAWGNLVTPGYCWYNNSIVNKNTYGAIYNWYVVNTKKLCPTGWHVPTYYEWKDLEDYLIANGYNYDGSTSGNKIAKALASTTGWLSSSNVGSPGNSDYSEKRNATGFTALPVGGRIGNGNFDVVGYSGGWWSSTPKDNTYIWGYDLYYYNDHTSDGGYSKMLGFSVRCIRDEPVSSVPAEAKIITGRANVCKDETNIVYTVPAIAAATSYKWTLPTGATGTSNSNSISVTFNNSSISGNISVRGHNDFGDGAESSLAITVLPIPEKPTITQKVDSLMSSALIGNQWYYNNTLISGATNQKLVINKSGQYYVVATTSEGCVTNPSDILYATYSWADGLQNYQLKIYPNPTTGMITISGLPEYKKLEISVVDMSGRIVKRHTITSVDASVNISHVTPGSYLLVIDGQVNQAIKIIKE